MNEFTDESKRDYKEEEKLVKHVKDCLERCHKEPYEQQIYLNISYFAGKQWIKLDPSTNQLVAPTMESWQVRYTANEIQPRIVTAHSKIIGSDVTMYVNPASADDEDVKAARVADKIIEWMEYDLNLQEKDDELCLWGLNSGIAFQKPFWNPSKGQIVSPDGMREGGPDCCIVSLFELKFDTSYSRWDELPWICHEKARTVDYIKQVYGVDVKPESGLTATNLYEAKLAEVISGGMGIAYKKLENSAVVSEFWEKPSSNYPKGRRITICGEKVLLYEEDIGFGEADNTERELPFFPFVNIQVPGRLIPTTIVEQLIPVQREYNRARSKIKEHNNLVANPILLVPVGSIADGEEITNEPGQILYTNPVGQSPSYLNPPTLGADVYRDIDLSLQEFDYISLQHETSHGTTPTGVTSGTAIGYLQEQDDIKQGPTTKNFIRCKQKVRKYLLKMVRYKCTTERTINIAGRNKKSEVLSFVGSSLTSIDVRVLEIPSRQKSKAATQDKILSLIQYGFLIPTNEHDKQIAMKILEFGIMDDLYLENEQDISQAQTENDKWQKGDLSPIVEDFYNHDAHIKEHNKFRKGEIYSQLPDNIKNAIAIHVELHKQFALNQLLASMPPTEPEQTQTPPKTETTTQNQSGIFMG